MSSINRNYPVSTAQPVIVNSGYRHIFSPLPCPFWNALKQYATLLKLKRRSILYQTGDIAKSIYLVEEGLVLLSNIFRDGREIGQVILPQGSLFGEQEIINKNTRIHQATALTNCKIWMLTEKNFIRQVNITPDISYYLAKTMSARLQRSELRLGYFSTHDVAQRLAQLLLELAETAGNMDESGLILSPCPTHCELASLIVATRETVSLVMGEFRRKRLISFDRRKLQILEYAALHKY